MLEKSFAGTFVVSGSFRLSEGVFWAYSGRILGIVWAYSGRPLTSQAHGALLNVEPGWSTTVVPSEDHGAHWG